MVVIIYRLADGLQVFILAGDAILQGIDSSRGAPEARECYAAGGSLPDKNGNLSRSRDVSQI